MEVLNLKRIVAKNPKSLLFAYLADSLRESSLGIGEKLDEALEVANKGLDANPDFLQGLLVRGRILFEKGDLSDAKIDFETVAARDQYCLSAQKLLLEASKKMGQAPETEIYAKILNTLGTEQPSAGTGEDLVPFESSTKKTEAVVASLSSALDDVLTEEGDDESNLITIISQAIDKIILKNVAKTPPASPKPAPAPAPKSEPKPLPSLSLPEATGSIFEKAAPKPEPKPAPQPIPNLDDLVNEQLASKVEDIPDLTKDMASLLADAIAVEPEPELELTPHISAAPPNLDDLVNEQLASKMEDIPDLTKDMASLLDFASDSEESDIAQNIPTISTAPAAAPNLDDLVNEQLASKMEDIPDLTKDMASLLADAIAVAPEPEPELTSHISAMAPNLDDLVNEQLASKMEDIPDLTKDMASLLADAISESEVEPELAPYIPSSPAATPSVAVPNLDDLVNEQLASKMEDIPDLTKDMASLLADAISESEVEPELAPYIPSSPAATPSVAAPNLDDLVNEQLASKVEDIPDLTKDMASLLADINNELPATENEPELIPYVPPSKRNTEATEAIKHPTLTLAELYMDQGLPNQAIEVYKELLALEPNNEDVKTKLALAEIQAKA